MNQSEAAGANASFGDQILSFYEARSGCLLGYQMVSTAPTSVKRNDRPFERPPEVRKTKRPWGEQRRADQALRAMVEHMKGAPRPRVVIQVHGYNNPAEVLDDRYADAFEQAATSCLEPGGVWIGYRWPSEKAPLGGVAALLMVLLSFLVPIAGVVALAYFVANGSVHWAWPAAIAGSACLAGVLLAVLVFKLLVYWRDAYRAMHLAAPDLVEFVRQLDYECRREGLKSAVELSFIAHSMGSYVTTSVVRILSDVFDASSMRPWTGQPLEASAAPGASGPHDVGYAFRLATLTLVSPDIPAESIMTRRTNFLAASLRRFPESYLFSNDGDVVLGMVSGLANSFSFPAKFRKYGHRLGNVAVCESLPFGLHAMPRTKGDDPRSFVRRGMLELHNLDLTDLDNTLEDATGSTFKQRLMDCFGYVDCTEYREAGEKMSWGRGFLGANRFSHFLLLISYLARGKPDVHSGYFDGRLTKWLIYGLAFRGWEGLQLSDPDRPGTAMVVGKLAKELEACRIRVVHR